MEQTQELGSLQVTICGGGNGAHFTAAVLGSNPQFRVNILTRKPEKWKKQVIAHTKGSAWEPRGEIKGNLNIISSDGAVVSKGTHVFIVCGPAHIHLDLMKKIEPYVEKGAYVGTLYGQGGSDWMAQHIFGSKLQSHQITIFALQNIPSICKIRSYGESVNVIGPKEFLYVCASPPSKGTEVTKLIGGLFGIKTYPLPNFLSVTLTPSNQIIHPGRVYGLFKDWDGKSVYDPAKMPLLYEDCDDLSADTMQALDDEIQAIKAAILKHNPSVDLNCIIPMKERIMQQYGSQIKDTTSLKTVFRTNIGYSTLKVPVKQMPGGVIVDIDGRLFWEDVPFGLCILKDMAQILGIKTPTTDHMILWHQQFMGKEYLLKDGRLNPALIHETGAPSRYGITTVDGLLKMSTLQVETSVQLPQPRL